MKRKNKLPRYWLGTKTPTSLGYQPNYGIGNAQFTSTPGESLEPEVRSIRNNIIPNALGKAQTYGNFALNALDAWKTAKAAKTAATSTAETAGKGAATAGKAASSSLGTVIGGIGGAIGLTDMGIQLFNNQDHRTAGQMRNTLATNTYTTDLGNTYTTHSGPNGSAELNYSKAQRTAKNVDFTTTALGTGASIGSIFGPYGTAIGAGAGLLVGLGASLLGFGDTEEETRQQMNTLSDAVAMENRMNESVAYDKDAKQAFYGRTQSGNIAQAAKGKAPYGNMKGSAHGDKIELLQGPDGIHPGVASSMGMPGEQMYSTTSMNGGEIKGTGNGDTQPLDIKPGDPTAIYSRVLKMNGKSFADIAKPYIEHQNQLNKIKENAGGSDRQKQFQIEMADRAMQKNHQALLQLSEMQDMIRRNNETAKYKCGKLPKYLPGKTADYIMSTVPNLASMIGAISQYNIDKEMPISSPNIKADYSSARNDIYRSMYDIDKRPYMNLIDEETRPILYNISRNPIYGPGGKMILGDSANIHAMQQKARTALDIDEKNMARRAANYNALASINQHDVDVNNQNKYKDYAFLQQAAKARYDALRTDRQMMINPLAAMFKDYSAIKKYYDSLAFGDKKLKLIDRSLTNQEKNWINGWADQENYDLSGSNLFSRLNLLPPAQQQYILGQLARRSKYTTVNGLNVEGV